MLKYIIFLILFTLTTPTYAQEASTETHETSALQKAHDWAVAFMVKVARPGRKIWYEGGQETKEEALARYDKIAWDIVRLAYSQDTIPVFSSKSHGRSQTAAIWMGIMLHESGFAKHVDLNIGRYGRGDGGRSWCMMQLRIGKGTTVPWNTKEDRQPRWGDDPADIFEGYTGEQIIADRSKCIEEGHHLVRASFKSCKKLGLLDRLTAYTIGKCRVTRPEDPDDVEYVRVGRAKSRARVSSGIKYFASTKMSRGFTDEEVIAELAENPDISFVTLAKKKGSDPQWNTSNLYAVAFVPPHKVGMPSPVLAITPRHLGAQEMKLQLLNSWPSLKELQSQEARLQFQLQSPPPSPPPSLRLSPKKHPWRQMTLARHP